MIGLEDARFFAPQNTFSFMMRLSRPVAGLVAVLIGGILSASNAASACSVGLVSVLASGGTFSCVSAYNGPKFVAHAASSNDCPGDSKLVSIAVGMMCQKTLASGSELILRPDDRCPSGYRRFVDMDGALACRPPPAASAVTSIAWPKCRNGAIPLITPHGEQCRFTAGMASVAAAGATCPASASPALDVHHNPICVVH